MTSGVYSCNHAGGVHHLMLPTSHPETAVAVTRPQFSRPDKRFYLSTHRQNSGGFAAPLYTPWCAHHWLLRATVSWFLSMSRVQMFWCGVLWSSSTLSARLKRPLPRQPVTPFFRSHFKLALSEQLTCRVTWVMESKGPTSFAGPWYVLFVI